MTKQQFEWNKIIGECAYLWSFDRSDVRYLPNKKQWVALGTVSFHPRHPKKIETTQIICMANTKEEAYQNYKNKNEKYLLESLMKLKNNMDNRVEINLRDGEESIGFAIRYDVPKDEIYDYPLHDHHRPQLVIRKGNEIITKISKDWELVKDSMRSSF
tara:strand:+ start:640 stop:1113 length:474 start_codon:yes stop_codon:yes gene_type:complete